MAEHGRLIDADALIKNIETDRDASDMPRMWYQGIEYAINHISHATTIEPESRWIPCSERLPEEDIEVIVSCTDDSGDSEFSYVTTGWHFKGIWVVDNERSFLVRAWMPLPKPYAEMRQDE